jgi:hypothetical protein
MKPQYRADHIGSFLRPPHLLIARARRQEGQLTADELRAIALALGGRPDRGLAFAHARAIPPRENW